VFLDCSDILAPHLTPGGHLLAVPEDDAPLLADEVRLRLGSSLRLARGMACCSGNGGNRPHFAACMGLVA